MTHHKFTLITLSSILLVLGLSGLTGTALAQNENEQIGFSEKHLFDGDHFGENLDILNGNLVLTVPIGQAYRVTDSLEYRLLLTYNSKFWIEEKPGLEVTVTPLLVGSTEAEWEGRTDKELHNAGLGFRLHMGRIFYAQPYPNTVSTPDVSLDPGWYYEDQQGAAHPIAYCPVLEISSSADLSGPFGDPVPIEEAGLCPTTGDYNHYETVDGTYMRAEKIFDSVTGDHTGWYLYPGDGTKMTFLHHPDGDPNPKLDPDAEVLRGFYVTRIESVEKYVTVDNENNETVLPYDYIDITYGGSLIQHSIVQIDEYRADPAIPEDQQVAARTILFTNESSLTVPSCDPQGGTRTVDVHGGLVTSVTLPAFGGSTATYDFEYCIDDVSAPIYLTCRQFAVCSDADALDEVFEGVPLLKRIVFPATSPTGNREAISFSYEQSLALPERPFDVADTGTYGELMERILPTGAVFRYQYDNYDYGSIYPTPQGNGSRKGGTIINGTASVTETRHVTRKYRYDDAADATPEIWTYLRSGDMPGGASQILSSVPSRVHVINPEGNETVYYYYAPDLSRFDDNTPSPTIAASEPGFFLSGYNYRIDTYKGSWGTGKLMRRERFKYNTFRNYDKYTKRNTQRVYGEAEISDDGNASSQHARKIDTWVYDTLGHPVFHQETDLGPAGQLRSMRTQKQAWRTRDQLSAFQVENWVIHLQENDELLDRGGRVLVRNEYTTTEEGKLRSQVRLANPEMGPDAGEDLQTTYCFDGDDRVGVPPPGGSIYPVHDPTAAAHGCNSEPNPDGNRSGNIILKKLSGGATPDEPAPALYEIEYTYQAGGYLAGKRFRENGVPLAWWAIERDRDPQTGLIEEARDTAGVSTRYTYDELGRIRRIEPDTLNGFEHPTEIRYPSITRTVVMQGASSLLGTIAYDAASPCTVSGDFICSEYLYDGLARLVETRKRQYDDSLASVHRCYTPSGKPSEQSESILAVDPFQCGDVSPGAAARTWTYYTAAGESTVDPLNRPRRIVSADGWLTEYDYSGRETTIRVNGLNHDLTAAGTVTTVQERDGFDRLISVDSDGGADAEYVYDEQDWLVEVSLDGTDEEGQQITQKRNFTYDGLGRMIEEIHPENGRTVYLAFDPLGNALQNENSDGKRFQSVYDAAGRPLREELAKFSKNGRITWKILANRVYDTSQFGDQGDRPIGKLTRVLNYDDDEHLLSERKLQYAGLNGRVDLEETWLGEWGERVKTTYQYTGLGLLARLEYPGDPSWTQPLGAQYEYTNGFLSAVSTQNAPTNLIAANFTYNPAGGIQSWEAGNGTRTTIESDVRNRPGRIYVDRDPSLPSTAMLTDPEANDETFLMRLGHISVSPYRVVGGPQAKEPKRRKEPGEGGGGGGGISPEDNSTACHDEKDNDADHLTDCADPECYVYCNENLGQLCSDGVDNDLNGFTDCADPGCTFFCTETTYSRCHDGQDNDADGFTDCNDSECAVACTPEESYEACTNGIDDNANFLTDCEEPYCQSLFCGPQPTSEDDAALCADRLDNDWDGKIDCGDPDCAAQIASCRFWDSGLYLYDGSGNITDIGLDHYEYDRLNRLTYASLSTAGNNWVEYGYDPFGNMGFWEKGQQGLPANAAGFFNMDLETNRIRSKSVDYAAYSPFQYDAVGNLVQDERYLYQYDARKRLVQVDTLTGSSVATYYYDSSDHRIQKIEDGKTTYYVRDATGKVLTEFVAEGVSNPRWDKAYVYANDQQLGMLSSLEGKVDPPERVGAIIEDLPPNSRSVLVYWTDSPSPAVAGYIVHRRAETGTAAALTEVPNYGNTYLDSAGLQAGETYYYSVQAIDRSGNQSVLSPESAVEFSAGSPPMPTISSLTQVDNAMVISWILDPNATSEEIANLHLFELIRYIGVSPPTVDTVLDPNGVLNETVASQSPSGYEILPLDLQMTTPYTFEDSERLESGKTYSYQVCALGRAGEALCSEHPFFFGVIKRTFQAAPSDVPVITGGLPEAGPVQRPAEFSAEADPTSAQRINLSWRPVGGQEIAEYRIYEELTGGTLSLMATAGPGTSSHVLTATDGIQPGTLYRFRLAAVDLQSRESAPSAIAETRTRSVADVPQFEIKRTTCEPSELDVEGQGQVLCGVHKSMARDGWFWTRIAEIEQRDDDPASRYGFRRYFRPCDPAGMNCGAWSIDDTETSGYSSSYSSLEGATQYTHPSLVAISNDEVTTQSNSEGQSYVVDTYVVPPDPNGVVYRVFQRPSHLCRIGEYAYSTVRGHVEGDPSVSRFVIDEESVLSIPEFFNPNEAFRNVEVYDEFAPVGDRYKTRLRSWSSCQVGSAGIGDDAHLYTGQRCILQGQNGHIIGYRIYWMPVPYCGVRGYNVYSVHQWFDRDAPRKGPLGQLSPDSPFPLPPSEDLNRNGYLDDGTCIDTGEWCMNDNDCRAPLCVSGVCEGTGSPCETEGATCSPRCGSGFCEGSEDLDCDGKLSDALLKLNTELITGHHFDYYPPLTEVDLGFTTKWKYETEDDAHRYYALPHYVTVEAVLDDATLPLGSPLNDLAWERFSCPMAVADVHISYTSPEPHYLTCEGSFPAASDNGVCWTDPFLSPNTEDLNGNGVLDPGTCTDTGLPCINDQDCGGVAESCVGEEDGNQNNVLDGGSYRADYIAAAPGFEGTICTMEPFTWGETLYMDPEGVRLKTEIWASLENGEPELPAPPKEMFSCGETWIATANKSTGLGLMDASTVNGRPTVIAGIAELLDESIVSFEAQASPHRPIGSSTMPANEITYYHTDHLGSVRLTTDQHGFKVRETVFWPFGEEAMPAAWDTNTHRFTGHERDSETGLDYMLARYYSPGLGRFLAVDPIQESAEIEDPQSWNRYGYAGNNPVKFIDPDGKVKFATTQAQNEYNQAKPYLSSSKEGKKVIANLEALSGSNEPTLALNSNHNDSFDPSTNTLNWDPTSGLDVSGEGGKADSQGGTIQSPALGLLHEADHAVQANTDPAKQNKDAGKSDSKYGNKEEKRVIKGSEKKAAKQLGEPTRKTHGGKPVRTTGSTSKKVQK
ncbi:MAG: hypothetical protein O7F16_04525 [Acidobacteria bacterium]|nr:hypothetical protein [Acidobacteriota bacterium]